MQIKTFLAVSIALSLVTVSATSAQDRMPPIPPEKYDAAQKKAARAKIHLCPLLPESGHCRFFPKLFLDV